MNLLSEQIVHIDEWNKFHNFMMSCVVDYLKHGLVKAESINLNRIKQIDKTCSEFIEFADAYFVYNAWMDKREFLQNFKDLYPNLEFISSHQFTKWVRNYCIDFGFTYDDKSSGGNAFFILLKKEVKYAG